MNPYWFFLSYAREDGDEYLKKKFWAELVSSVRMKVGGATDGIGFLDTSAIGLGDRWPDALGQALSSCRIFLPLYTPTYFTKEFCGKEWAVFQARLEALAQGGKPAPLILPILWAPKADLPAPLPDVVSDLQFLHADTPEIYAQEGLWKLLRLTRYRDTKLDIIDSLAKRVVAAAKAHPLPPLPALPDLKLVVSAWESQSFVKPDEGPTAGPRYVQFIFVAGKRAEMQNLRQGLDFYGDEGGIDWHPYLPEIPYEVSRMAQSIASLEDLRYETVALDDHLIERLEKAEQENKVVAILVDTWTLRLNQYQGFMREYDKRHFLNCVVLAPWNAADAETQGSKPLLEAALRAAFKRKALMRDPNHILEGINSFDDLQKQLRTALNAARIHIINSAKVYRKAEGPEPVPFRTIQAVRG